MLKKLAEHRLSIKFAIDVAACLSLALTCSIALKLAAAEAIRHFEVPSDRHAIEILNSNQR